MLRLYYVDEGPSYYLTTRFLEQMPCMLKKTCVGSVLHSLHGCFSQLLPDSKRVCELWYKQSK